MKITFHHLVTAVLCLMVTVLLVVITNQAGAIRQIQAQQQAAQPAPQRQPAHRPGPDSTTRLSAEMVLR